MAGRLGVGDRPTFCPDSEVSGALVQCIMVFYGLAVALIAVSVFQTYSDVSKIISGEASALNALYRDVRSYPEPIRLELQKELREYTDQVIHVVGDVRLQR